MERLDSYDAKQHHSVVRDLIFTVDKEDKIIKFNEECEKISGFLRDDVLNKSFLDVLIPNEYDSQWKNILFFVRKNKLIDDFNLPIINRSGKNIMVSWSSFPIKDFGGKVEDIGFVGNIIKEKKEKVIKSSYKSNLDIENAEYFNEFEKVLKDFEKEKKQLEKKNLLLQKKLERKKEKNTNEKQIDPIGKSLYQVSDFFGGRKKKKEMHALFNELDQREKHLNNLEAKLEKDKQKITEQKKDLIKWRKKLEKLESEVESRIKWVENKEKAIESYIATNINENSTKSKLNDRLVEEYKYGTINNIDDCAAVVQRGIFKEVNSTLAELLGYNVSEIVEKSIFDFIIPEGFSGIEEYYLERLKGEDVFRYDTMLLTKDNVKISIEVNTKPIIFNGEKAEIAVFKKLKIHQTE